MVSGTRSIPAFDAAWKNFRARMPRLTPLGITVRLAVAGHSRILMGDISDWVLSTAIAAASHWHHGDWPDACVAINLAPSQLLDPHFVSGLVSRLQEFRLPARCIELELTESVLQTGPATIETLHHCDPMESPWPWTISAPDTRRSRPWSNCR
jgi:predicted signal transduction protein with EAL and GGDEF domain